MQSKQRLVVALDVPERERLLSLGAALAPHCGMLKVGLEAFVAHGPALVSELRATGAEIFLDLKLHDIPRTVAAAVRRARLLDVRLLTIHAAGGKEMVEAAVDAAAGRCRIIAVTVLTSLDAPALAALGLGAPVDVAKRFAEVALGAGAAGVVCSSHELAALRHLPGERIVPGIRPSGADAGDQKRVATPKEAVAAGATRIVVGRPILDAADPVRACTDIVAELS